jgi:hypothetical protein
MCRAPAGQVAAAIRYRIWQRRLRLQLEFRPAPSLMQRRQPCPDERALCVRKRVSGSRRERRRRGSRSFVITPLSFSGLWGAARAQPLTHWHHGLGTCMWGISSLPLSLSLWLCPCSSSSSPSHSHHQRDGASLHLERLHAVDESQGPGGFKKGVAALLTERLLGGLIGSTNHKTDCQSGPSAAFLYPDLPRTFSAAPTTTRQRPSDLLCRSRVTTPRFRLPAHSIKCRSNSTWP